jgi:nucleotide-binding universal stress UspA family protein
MIDGFKDIMLPVDFSAHSDRAVEYATWLGHVCHATVHLVHVVANPADGIYEPEDAPHWVLVEHAQQKATGRLEETARTAFAAQTPHRTHVAVGDPYEKLMEIARRIPADLIVMSTHGRGGVTHLVMGSVAEKIVRHAPCPVFVVRRSA